METHNRKSTLKIAAGAALLSAFVGGALVSAFFFRAASRVGPAPGKTGNSADATPTKLAGDKSFSDEDKLKYWKALLRVRYELLSGPEAPNFEETVSDDHVRELIREAEKKSRLLHDYCGIGITEEMVQREAERMRETYKRKDVMLKIADALDREPQAVVEFWIKPILVDRYLRACVAYDPRVNGLARQEAEAVLSRLAGGDDSGLELSRVRVDLAGADTEDDDRKALLGLKPGQVSAVVEGVDDFHVFRVISREGETVEVDMASIKKPDFEQWLKARP